MARKQKEEIDDTDPFGAMQSQLARYNEPDTFDAH